MSPTPHPELLPLREVLRGLRHGLRRSRRVLREALPLEALPPPARILARPVLGGLDALADEVDLAGSDLAKRLLGGEPQAAPPFEALTTAPGNVEDFAAVTYAVLRDALRQLGDGDAFVSEAAARRAYDAASGRRPPGSRDDLAADLLLALVEAGAVRDVAPAPGFRIPAGEVAAVAAASAMLWLLAEHEGSDSDAALRAATDIAVAIAGELVPAVAARDRPRLARLLGEFAAHV